LPQLLSGNIVETGGSLTRRPKRLLRCLLAEATSQIMVKLVNTLLKSQGDKGTLTHFSVIFEHTFMQKFKSKYP